MHAGDALDSAQCIDLTSYAACIESKLTGNMETVPIGLGDASCERVLVASNTQAYTGDCEVLIALMVFEPR